jgi:hypothetical protein
MARRRRVDTPLPEEYNGKVTVQADPVFWASLVVLRRENGGEPFQAIIRRLTLAEVDKRDLGDTVAEFALQVNAAFSPTDFTERGHLRGAGGGNKMTS